MPSAHDASRDRPPRQFLHPLEIDGGPPPRGSSMASQAISARMTSRYCQAVSREKVELVRRIFQALNRGDLPEAMRDTTVDFVFDFSRSKSFERGVYERENIGRLDEAFSGVWDSVRSEPEEFIEAGDHLVTPIATRNRGRDGIEVHTRVAWLWSFRDGQVARVTFFQGRREALEAAGLAS